MRVDRSAAFVQVFITRFPLAYRCFSCRKIKRMPSYVPFYTCAIFDFFRKKEQASDTDNKNSLKSDNHQLFKYIVDRSTADWNQVVKFGKGLEKTRENWSKQFQRLFTTDEMEQFPWKELEAMLYSVDLGTKTTKSVLQELRKIVEERKYKQVEDVKAALKEVLYGLIVSETTTDASSKIATEPPTVVFLVGSNGMGKTTSTGKLGYKYSLQGKKVLLVACDTYRAAAVEQLEIWASRSQVDIYTPKPKQYKPTAILFDALEKAVNEKYDLVLVDTCGRMHNNETLMKELSSMCRIVEKKLGRGPDEVLLVLDGVLGRNASTQVKAWKNLIPVTGLVVTKLDGTGKAGYLVSIIHEDKLPVKWIGVGEGLEDLRSFDPQLFIQLLFD
ncbi:hypothetical protein GAYE_SCF62G6613 [Galdieria yellowstonensis]|uniref:SRP54-type proteins GTP-binding domain-containing protein n=1 Tax=Galdieria yellowstonensis TaxID=3028027 RepID=A0AAV9IN16_9RHOD|nr:hypothetical protein GAYE_SCF62G6613 [Galdieria yellowstonensis]